MICYADRHGAENDDLHKRADAHDKGNSPWPARIHPERMVVLKEARLGTAQLPKRQTSATD